MQTLENIVIDVATPELHKHIKQFQIRNPSINDLAVIMEMAIAERWPGARVDDVLRAAEINWLALDRRNMVMDTARNMKDWIDTGIQGDMFNDLQMSVPKWVLDENGEPVEYYKRTLPQIREYMASLAQSTETQAIQLEVAAKAKRDTLAQLRQQIANIDIAVMRAIEAGIDPKTLRYDQAG